MMSQFKDQDSLSSPSPVTAEQGFAHDVGRAGLGVSHTPVSLSDPHPNPPHRGEGTDRHIASGSARDYKAG